MRTRILIIVLITILVGCNRTKKSTKKASDSDLLEFKLNDSMIDSNGFLKISEINVRELLSALVLENGQKADLNIITTIGQTKTGWLDRKDLEFLVSKIESKQKAKCINRVISSFLPDSKNMTIGNQAISILETFRNNQPYPNELYVCETYGQEKIVEIKKWWNEYKNGS